MVPTLVLAVYTTLYVYIQPYKSRLANVIESAVNMNFLLLLILNSTAFFHDDYLTFPAPAEPYNSTTDSCSGSVRGVATVSWVLMPFYYIPPSWHVLCDTLFYIEPLDLVRYSAIDHLAMYDLLEIIVFVGVFHCAGEE